MLLFTWVALGTERGILPALSMSVHRGTVPQPWLCAHKPAAGSTKNRIKHHPSTTIQSSPIQSHLWHGAGMCSHSSSCLSLQLTAADSSGHTGEGVVLLRGEQELLLSSQSRAGTRAYGAMQVNSSHQASCHWLPQNSALAACVG